MSDKDQAIMLYGAMWCPDTVRSRRFLDENGVTYQWFDIDKDPEARAFVRRSNNGQHSRAHDRFPGRLDPRGAFRRRIRAKSAGLVLHFPNTVANSGNALKAEPVSPWGGPDVIRPVVGRNLLLGFPDV